MRLVSLISSLALLGASVASPALPPPSPHQAAAHALPHPHRARAELAENPGLEITDLVIGPARDGGNTTISFHLYNPDTLSNANATCTGTWPPTTKGNPQSDYKICGKTKMAWGFKAYSDINNFTLNVQDRFKDPALGKPPYDQAAVFGLAAFNETNLECDNASCRSPKDTVVEAPIYATIA